MAHFVLHAPNIHGGGGLTLFKALLSHVPSQACLIIDERLPIPDQELTEFRVYRVKPTIWQRFMAERLLRQLASKGGVVFCFGNLPPLFSLKARVTLLVQNRYLVEPNIIKSTPFKLRLRLAIESWWLRLFQKNIDKVIVQTPSMKALTSKYVSAPIIVAPFAAPIMSNGCLLNKTSADKEYDFIYVASGDSHKNHRNLIRAWVLLAQEGLFPSLCLTLNPSVSPDLVMYADHKSKKFDLRITNVGKIEGLETLELYEKAKALVFPSTLESFGLPLIEARNASLIIVASELDYVRDILDPEETFDPSSPVSISRAIKRSLRVREKACSLVDGQEIIDLVMSD